MPEWKYNVALNLIARNPRITAQELGAAMCLNEKVVSKIMTDLYIAGYIDKKIEGKEERYCINPNQPMRQKTRLDVSVDEFLGLRGCKRSHRNKPKAVCPDKRL
jgi:hypothetical protein